MSNHRGKCVCGDVSILLRLPASQDKYTPRQCDCDFCMIREIAYVSHPDGELEIDSITPLKILKQGSNQALFITCDCCKTVIAASVNINNQTIGSLNIKLLDDLSLFNQPIIASPKNLEPKEKLERWQSNWGKVKLNSIFIT